MSLERAYVACGECYRIASGETKEGANFGVRIEAMKAFEDSQRDCRDLVKTTRVKLDQTVSYLAIKALGDCGSCDYSEPLIQLNVGVRPEEMQNE